MFKVRLRHGGSGEPLVYLHGGTGGSAGGSMSSFLDLLAERYEVFVPMHPGWGPSTGVEHLDNCVDMALYYHDFFDELGLKSVNLAGTSLGGMFAAEIAAINGSYVRKLVLAAPAGLLRKELPYLPPETPPGRRDARRLHEVRRPYPRSSPRFRSRSPSSERGPTQRPRSSSRPRATRGWRSAFIASRRQRCWSGARTTAW